MNVDSNFKKYFFYKNQKMLLILILIIAFLIRLYAVYIGYGSNHFSKVDEVEAYQFGMNFYYFSNARIFGAYLPGPWQSLIVYLLIKIFNSVIFLYLFVALIGVWNVYLIYWLSKIILNYTSKKNDKLIFYVPLLSALFYAIMPWPVKFSVSFWNPHFFIPLITLFLGYFIKILYKNNSKSILGAIWVLSLMPFFHLEIVYAIIPIFLLILIKLIKPELININSNNRKINLKYLLFGIVLSIFVYIPFLYFDWKNGFYILTHYIKGSTSFYKFRPETFKIFSNIIIVMTDEISRFTGHNFNQYKYFLNRAFGHYFIGFLFILPSFIIVLFAYIKFFKSFTKDRVKFFIGYWIISTAFFHLLSGMPHELRYTIIWFPFLIYIIVFEVCYYVFSKNLDENENSFNIKEYEKIKKDKIKNIWEKKLKQKRIIAIIFFLSLLTGFYINLQHYYQERYPNYKNEVRLIPSLIIYEKIKKAIIFDSISEITKEKYKYKIYKTSEKLVNYFTLDDVSKKKSYSLYYFIPSLQSKAMFFTDVGRVRRLVKSDRFYTYYISSNYIFKKWSKSRQMQIIKLIKKFINLNTNLITDDKKKADFIIYFVDKKYYEKYINKEKNNKNNINKSINDVNKDKINKDKINKDNINKNSINKDITLQKGIVIGKLSNCYIIKVDNK